MGQDDEDGPAPPDLGEIRLRRRQETIRSIRARRTMMERWEQTLDLSADQRWLGRAHAAAKFIPAGARVLDLGCGDMKLEKLLPPGCSYLPVDVVRRDDRTIVVDLNKQILPKIEADFVCGLGVLEYIFDLPRLLRRIGSLHPRGLFSYHPLEESPARDRLSLGWSNALNTPELVAIMRFAGYRKVAVRNVGPGVIFLEVAWKAPETSE